MHLRQATFTLSAIRWFPAAMVFLLLATHAGAQADASPAIVEELLSESTPSAFTPIDFDSSDFELEWVGPALEGVQAVIEPSTLQWVRVGTTLVLPRGRLVVTAPPDTEGVVEHAGRSQAFTTNTEIALTAPAARVEIPIALLASPDNLIHIRLGEPGPTNASSTRAARAGRLEVRFRPRSEVEQRLGSPVLYDSSCSRIDVSGLVPPGLKHWMYLGCHSIHVLQNGRSAHALELLVHLANAPESIDIAGAPLTRVGPGLWRFNLRGTGQLRIRTGGPAPVVIRYAIPPTDPRGFLGVGLGPYQHSMIGAGAETNGELTAMPTFYGSYRLSETARITAFDATAIHSSWFTDFGLYLNTRSFRTIDNRLTLNLMFGGHALAFSAMQNIQFRPGIPQGLEVIVSDFALRRYNLNMGAFIYPRINDRSYYNLWLRWGNQTVFVEFNYISWHDQAFVPNEATIFSRSLGLSVGVPLLSFL